RFGLVAAVLAVIFLAWTQFIRPDLIGAVVAVIAAAAFVAGLLANRQGREGRAFAATAVAIVAAVYSLFITLYPAVLPSSINEQFDLTVDNASASPYPLRVMTIIAAVFFPLVVAYQAWTYYIFRKRIGREHIPAEAHLEMAPMHPGAATAAHPD